MNKAQLMSKLCVLGIFLTVVSILFYKVFFLGEVMYYADNFQVNAPMKTILIDSIKNKQIPLWDPYIHLGMPYFADLNLGTLYPLNILYFIFSPVLRSVSLQVAADIFILLVSTFFFLRNKKISIESSVLGSVIFSLSGSVFLLINNVTILNSVVYVPTLFLLVSQLIETKKSIYLYLLVVVQVLQIISGHPQITYYSILFVLLFIVFSQMPSRRKIYSLLFYLFFSAGMSALQTIPFLELVANSSRIWSLNPQTGSYSILGMITLLFPTIFGSILDGTWWGKQYVLTGYIGIPTIIVFLIGIKRIARKTKFYIFLLIFALILSFGFPINLIIPGMILFRDCVFLLVFCSFFIAVIVSTSVDKLAHTEVIINKGWLGLTGVLFLISIFTSVLWSRYYQFVYTHIRFIHKLQELRIDKFYFIISNSLFQLIVLLFFAFITLLLFYAKKFYPAKYFLSALIILVSFNLIFFDRQVLLTAPIKTLPKVGINLDGLNSNYRVFSLPVNLGISKNTLPGNDFFFKEGKKNIQYYRADLNVPHRVNQIAGFSSVVPNSLSNYFGSKDITGITIKPSEYRKLSDLSVSYIIDNGKVTHVENVHPRLYCSCTISSIDYQINSTSLVTDATHAGVLINTDQYFPGWVGTINGKRVEIKRYNSILREIEIPRGKAKVVLTYSPNSFYIGCVVSSFSFILFVLFFFFQRRSFSR